MRAFSGQDKKQIALISPPDYTTLDSIFDGLFFFSSSLFFLFLFLFYFFSLYSMCI